MPHETRETAHRLHALGATVLAIRTGEKKPAHAWRLFAHGTQARTQVDALPWERADRVGIVNGPRGYRSFDFDHCPTWEPIRTLIRVLGLPDDYRWIEQSGSGTGWHVWVRCTDTLPAGALEDKGGNERGVYWGKARTGTFDHLELRWERCQTIVASSDGVARWINGEPDAEPALVSATAVLRAFAAVAETPPPTAPPPDRPMMAPGRSDGRETLESIRARFDLAEYARRHFGGRTQAENGEVRILGNGGLLVEPERRVWYRHAGGQGGDCFDLVGYRRYGTQWDRDNRAMFREALREAAEVTGVPTEAIHVSRAHLRPVDPDQPGDEHDGTTVAETAWDAFLRGRQSIYTAIRDGIEPVRALVPPWVVAEQVTCLVGGPEQGKTWMLAHAALAVARAGGTILLLDEEAGLKRTAERMDALGMTAADDAHIFYFPFVIGGHTLADLTEAILEGVVRERFALIAVDSWSKLFAAAGLDENSNSDATKLSRAWITPAAHEYGCAVLLLDHTTKVEDDDNRYGRGAGSKLADVDIQWHIRAVVAPSRDSMGRLVLTRKKDRTATVPASVKFLAGGDGQGGFRITLEESTFKEQPVLHRKHADVARVLVGRTVTTYSQWKSLSDMSETSFRRARTALLEAGIVSQEQDAYWLSSLGNSMFDNESNPNRQYRQEPPSAVNGGTATTATFYESGGSGGSDPRPTDGEGDDDDVDF